MRERVTTGDWGGFFLAWCLCILGSGDLGPGVPVVVIFGLPLLALTGGHPPTIRAPGAV